ncbi:MAG: TonB family protein [Gammaproteobacteria bacterium PRO9]|nr:TonB family protein [Gammaproteobacteria bacterium PRO9]
MQAASTVARPPVTWSPEAARDRLSSTAFLAALFHGILILGISFSARSPDRGPVTSSMEVVLVTSDYEDRQPSPSAVLLAQKSISGAGNAPAEAAVRTAPGLPLPTDAAGQPQPGLPAEARPGTQPSDTPDHPLVLASNSPVIAPTEGEQHPLPRQQAGMLSSSTPIDILGRLDTATVVPDASPRDRLISANTRESRIATYLSGWKNKVEQVGTLNFPFAASQEGITKFPVLEVAIDADGRLRDVVVRISSGQRDLDQAAMQILRLAAPFEPFPAGLRVDYDVLRFAYEWRFSEGAGTIRAQSRLEARVTG